MTHPQDFAEICARLVTNKAIQDHYGIGWRMLANWREAASIPAQGTGGSKPTPLPEDFTAIAATTPNNDLAERYGVSITVVTRWRRDTGIRSLVKSKGRPRAKRPVPPDFATFAPDKSCKFLMGHYGARQQVVQRWRTECGLPNRIARPGRPRKPRPFKRSTPKKVKTNVLGLMGRPRTTIAHVPRDGSIHGSAADVLRVYAPTYRCDEDGRANPKGEWWRYGNVTITPDELLQRAEAKGWQPQRWAA